MADINFGKSDRENLREVYEMLREDRYGRKNGLEQLEYLKQELEDLNENVFKKSFKIFDVGKVNSQIKETKKIFEDIAREKDEWYKESGIASDNMDALLGFEQERQKTLSDIEELQNAIDSGKLTKEAIKVNKGRIDAKKQYLDQQEGELRNKLQELLVTGSIKKEEYERILQELELMRLGKSRVNHLAQEQMQAAANLKTIRENIDALKKYNREVNQTTDNINRWVDAFKNVGMRAYNMWAKIEAASKESAKAIGLNTEQTIAYQKAISKTAKELAITYGLSFEQSAKLQDMYNDATERSAILSENQMRNVAAMSTLVGEDTTRTVIENMDKLGGGVEAATVAIGKANLMAKAMGLNVVKASSAVAKNMSMANKYSFKNGVDGIMRMTMLSQKLKFNLESMGGVIDKFTNISDAIETSANLQMMGGEAAMLFGNPLENLYQGLNDPESLIEKATKMFASRAVFNRQTGKAELKGHNLQWVRNTAQMLGMNPDEAAQMARQSVKIQAIDAEMTNSAKGNQRVRDIIESKAEFDVAQKKHYVTYLDESGQRQRVDVSAINANNKELIDQIAAQDEPVEDIQAHVRKIAEALTPIGKKIEGIREAENIAEAEVFENLGIGDLLRESLMEDGKYHDDVRKFLELLTDGSWGTSAFMAASAISTAMGLSLQKGVAKGLAKSWYKLKNIGRGKGVKNLPETKTLAEGKVGSKYKTGIQAQTKSQKATWLAKNYDKLDRRIIQVKGADVEFFKHEGKIFKIEKDAAGKAINFREAGVQQTRQVLQEHPTIQNSGQQIDKVAKSSSPSTASTSKTSPTKKSSRKSSPSSKYGKTPKTSPTPKGGTSARAASASRLGRFAKFGSGAAIGAITAMYDAYTGWQDAKSQAQAKRQEINSNAAYNARQKQILNEANDATERTNKAKSILGATGGALGGALAGAAMGSALGPVGTFVGGIVGGLAGSSFGKSFASTDNRNDTDILQEDFETQKFGMDAIAKSLQVDPSGENLKLLAAQATIKMNDVLVSIWNKMNGKQSNGAVEQKGFIDNVADKGITAAIGSVFKNWFSSDKEKESKTHYFGAFKGEGDIDGGNGGKSISVPQNSVIGGDLKQEGKNGGIATVNSDEIVMHREKIINLGNAFNDLASTTNAVSSVNVKRNGNTVVGDYSNSISTFKGDNSTFVTTNGISQQYALAPVNQKPVEASYVTPMYSQPNFMIQPPNFGLDKMDLNINLSGSIDLKSDGAYNGTKLDADKLMKEQPYFMDRLTYIIMENITRKMHGGQRFGQTKM